MARTSAQLRDALNEARSLYGGQFAGQPRASRKPERLEALIAQARSVADEAGSAGHTELSTQAREQAEQWATELQAIREVQARGAAAVQAASLGQWLRDSFERYNRLFAGQNRATRDLGILREIVADLERRLVEVDGFLASHDDPDLASTRDAARDNLQTYRQELERIVAARHEGSPENRAGLLARLANAQFARYRLHFAGKSRISRRRQVLETIAGVLDEVRAEMAALMEQGVAFDGQAKNIEVVDGHLETYRAELGRIRAARNNASRADRVKALAEAANAVFSLYRAEFPGHARATRDEDRLAEIWELLWPVALEMEDLAREDDAEPVGSNLQKVRDSLRLYEREWQLIKRAKAD